MKLHSRHNIHVRCLPIFFGRWTTLPSWGAHLLDVSRAVTDSRTRHGHGHFTDFHGLTGSRARHGQCSFFFHGPSRACHGPSRTHHGPSRTRHGPSRACHGPSRTLHGPSRAVTGRHGPSRAVTGRHGPSRAVTGSRAHGPTGTSHGSMFQEEHIFYRPSSLAIKVTVDKFRRQCEAKDR